jgi:hypothetical protein
MSKRDAGSVLRALGPEPVPEPAQEPPVAPPDPEPPQTPTDVGAGRERPPEPQPQPARRKYSVLLTAAERRQAIDLGLRLEGDLGRDVDRSEIARTLFALASEDCTLYRQLVVELRRSGGTVP